MLTVRLRDEEYYSVEFRPLHLVNRIEPRCETPEGIAWRQFSLLWCSRDTRAISILGSLEGGSETSIVKCASELDSGPSYGLFASHQPIVPRFPVNNA
ncbi:hypothetical protein D3C86_1533430 [compost metagenome]